MPLDGMVHRALRLSEISFWESVCQTHDVLCREEVSARTVAGVTAGREGHGCCSELERRCNQGGARKKGCRAAAACAQVYASSCRRLQHALRLIPLGSSGIRTRLVRTVSTAFDARCWLVLFKQITSSQSTALYSSLCQPPILFGAELLHFASRFTFDGPVSRITLGIETGKSVPSLISSGKCVSGRRSTRDSLRQWKIEKEAASVAAEAAAEAAQHAARQQEQHRRTEEQHQRRASLQPYLAEKARFLRDIHLEKMTFDLNHFECLPDM